MILRLRAVLGDNLGLRRVFGDGFETSEHREPLPMLRSRVSTQGAPPVTPPGAGPPRGAPSARGWVFESKFSIVQKIILNLKFKNSHYFHIFNGSDQD